MTVEIISTVLDQGIVTISAVDCSDENLQRMERMRDDGFEKELEFLFDTHNKDEYLYLRRWLKSQKAAGQADTWGNALQSVCGTITTINGRYRAWD